MIITFRSVFSLITCSEYLHEINWQRTLSEIKN
jgi:hypothetical protein